MAHDVFSLFYSVWTNPDSEIFSIVKYLWSGHIKYLSQKYEMWDPVECLSRDTPGKNEYKEHKNNNLLGEIFTEIGCFKQLHEIKSCVSIKRSINKLELSSAKLSSLS